MVEVNSSKINIVIGSVAAVAVFFTILYIGMFNTGKYSPDITTGITENKVVVMPDSSLIHLSSNSIVKYHCNKFTGNRNVVLKGEAFFEVNEGRKFKVDFQGGNLFVNGTKFNVIAYSEQYIKVDCVEGGVDFKYGRYSISLKQGQGIKVYKGIITGPYSVEETFALEQLNNIHSWDRISVEELFFLLGSKYNYEIILDRHAGKRNFTGQIDMSDLQNSLSIISHAMDLDYFVDEENQTITIHAK